MRFTFWLLLCALCATPVFAQDPPPGDPDDHEEVHIDLPPEPPVGNEGKIYLRYSLIEQDTISDPVKVDKIEHLTYLKASSPPGVFDLKRWGVYAYSGAANPGLTKHVSNAGHICVGSRLHLDGELSVQGSILDYSCHWVDTVGYGAPNIDPEFDYTGTDQGQAVLGEVGAFSATIYGQAYVRGVNRQTSAAEGPTARFWVWDTTSTRIVNGNVVWGDWEWSTPFYYLSPDLCYRWTYYQSGVADFSGGTQNSNHVVTDPMTGAQEARFKISWTHADGTTGFVTRTVPIEL